jgi:alkanesulfonate monooxygenase SsuD/methylene tetrahydromethanopterin reductase-like flavin-dependent oxidoreductase (luciferase family)
MRLGLLIMDEDPRDAVEVARAADMAGVDSIWTIDYYNRSSLTRAAAFAVATERVGIGTSVTPLFARSPLALACAARDVQGLSRGRFVLGLGASTRRMNADWYGFDLDHPAPRVAERADLIRRLLAHQSGAFTFEGRLDSLRLAHFEHAGPPCAPPPLLGAAVGDHMVRAVATTTDGIVGHPIASVDNLEHLKGQCESRGTGTGPPFMISSQVIVSVGDDRRSARQAAAQQVGFYSTVKGYDALFGHPWEDAARLAARAAFASNDVAGVATAADRLVDDRAVFGEPGEVASTLKRYEPVLDLALLYSPHYGVEPADIKRNEMALIEVAAEGGA